MGWQFTFGGARRDLSDEERAAELKQNEYASVWEGGKVVDLDDLSPDVFDQIAREEFDSWWNIYRYPGGSGSRLYAIAKAAAEHAGVEVPSKPANMRESVALLELLERTEEPHPIKGGFPTTPSEETETASSDGSSDDSSGVLPKPKKNG